MAAVGFDDFPGPCSELALPPLFGGNILESELEQEVEFADAGLIEDAGGGGGGREEEEEEEEEEAAAAAAQELRREKYRRKYQALQHRCKEMESVNEMLLNRLEYVRKITQRFKKERRFLMKCLDSHGDSYRTAQLTILLEDVGSQAEETLLGDRTQSSQQEGADPHGPRPRPLAAQGSQESGSPLPGEGGTTKSKKIKDERDSQPAGKRHSSPFYILAHHQIKQECSDEEMSPRDGTEPLRQVWDPGSPEHKTGYSKYPSPASYPEFD
ncbi:TCF3 fusion partner [Carcharodon carcharias]|uniref:TCF3 fusion partner n=1 Tax=Carcharodon carcharias TaxID=13397 RepID=UPI001B7E8D7C|nr:TCF3 fusion partner [Carcharodon carcharias]